MTKVLPAWWQTGEGGLTWQNQGLCSLQGARPGSGVIWLAG